MMNFKKNKILRMIVCNVPKLLNSKETYSRLKGKKIIGKMNGFLSQFFSTFVIVQNERDNEEIGEKDNSPYDIYMDLLEHTY